MLCTIITNDFLTPTQTYFFPPDQKKTFLKKFLAVQHKSLIIIFRISSFYPEDVIIFKFALTLIAEQTIYFPLFAEQLKIT